MGVYDVKTEEVVICGQRFLVRQANTDDASIRANMITKKVAEWAGKLPNIEQNDLDKMVKDNDPGLLEYSKRSFETLTYPTIINCTKSLDAPLPTTDECYNMPDAELEKWIQTVKRLNPNYFSSTEDDEKKE